MTRRVNNTINRYVVRLFLGAAAIAGAELIARYKGFGDPPIAIRDGKIEYYLAPGNFTRFGQDIRVNRYSMRSDDVDLAVVDRSLSFSLFGDSIVYGSRLDQSDILPVQLQKLLRLHERGKGIVVNGIAASSWGPENLLEFYKQFGPFPGHTAWIIQSSHDMVDVIDRVGTHVPYATISPYGGLHDVALSAWRWAEFRLPSPRADPITVVDMRRRADVALHALIQTLRADYARVVLVFHATRDETISGKAEGLAHYEAFAEKHAVDFISTIELYRSAYRSNLAPHFDDIHLSKDGAHMLAQRLAADIRPIKTAD